MWPFGKKKVKILDDPDFGTLSQWKPGCWKNPQFEIWGYRDVQLLLDSTIDGLTEIQRTVYRELLASDKIMERIEEAIRDRIANTPGLRPGKPSVIKLTSLFLPPDPHQETWRVWYDLEGEESYCFGAEIKPTKEIVVFVED